MAKSTMGMGQFRGKVGGLVFAKGDAGEQIVRQYQPVVRNPRSDAQMSQRAKINLAGQISRLFSKSDVYPFGNSGRTRRGNFNKSLIEAITVVKAGADFKASLNYANIILSKGPVNLTFQSQPILNLQGEDININFRIYIDSGSFADGDIADLYIMLFKEGDSTYQPSVIHLSSANQDFTIVPGADAINTQVYVPTILAGAGVFASVYAVVKRPNASLSMTTDPMGGSNSEIHADISTSDILSGLNFSNSLYIGTLELAQ